MNHTRPSKDRYYLDIAAGRTAATTASVSARSLAFPTASNMKSVMLFTPSRTPSSPRPAAT